MTRFAFLKSEVNGGRQPLHYLALFFAKLAPALQTAFSATRASGISIHHRRLVNHKPVDLKFEISSAQTKRAAAPRNRRPPLMP